MRVLTYSLSLSLLTSCYSSPKPNIEYKNILRTPGEQEVGDEDIEGKKINGKDYDIWDATRPWPDILIRTKNHA